MARFVITDPAGRTQIFEISSPSVSLGREDSNDLVLAHPSVSRHHARITVLPGETVLLNDLGSMNGTFVNNVQVREHRLSDRDRITIGIYGLKFEAAPATQLHIEKGSGTVTDLDSVAGTEDVGTALRSAALPPTVSLSPEERAKLLEKENRLLKLLLAVGKTLSSVLTPDEIMRRVTELVFQMDNVERGFVMLFDEKKGFKPAVLLYKNREQQAEEREVALSSTVTERLLRERVPLLIFDVGTDERFRSSESLRLAGIRSAMCAPLVYKDRVFGIFYVDCLSKPYAFSQEELGIFSVIAAEAAISFDSARSHEELARREVERRALERFLSANIVERILASPDEVHLGGESQTVTILFADIRGFTRLAEHIEPQGVVELLNEYFSEMTDMIFESGGTLDKYLGDGIMAVYGAPLARPDDALRAAKTAMEMQRAMAALNRGWAARGHPALQMGVGVNTGPVVAGNIGSARRMDYTVIGDPVNLASRLCAHAAPGQILVSETTFSLLKGEAPAKRLEPIRVKGKRTPVELYEVLWH